MSASRAPKDERDPVPNASAKSVNEPYFCDKYFAGSFSNFFRHVSLQK